jgi:hypothetical protein
MVDLDLLVRLLGLVSLVRGCVFSLLRESMGLVDEIEDLDYLAYTIVILCFGRNGILVVLLDIDIVGKHVLGS